MKKSRESITHQKGPRTITLYDHKHTLADVVRSLDNYDTDFVKRVTRSQYDVMMAENEDGIPSIYLPIEVFLSQEDKSVQKSLYMVFIRNGQVHYSHNDVLSDIEIDEPVFFFNYKIPSIQNRKIYATDIIFTQDNDGIQDWSATYNYDAIFDAYFLNGQGYPLNLQALEPKHIV